MNDQSPTVATPAELKNRAVDLSKDTGRTLGAAINELGGEGMTAAGKKVDQLADMVTEKGLEAAVDERSPVTAEQIDATVGSIRAAASYLHESDPASVLQATDRAVRAHPYRSIAIGLCAGWMVGKLMSR